MKQWLTNRSFDETSSSRLFQNTGRPNIEAKFYQVRDFSDLIRRPPNLVDVDKTVASDVDELGLHQDLLGLVGDVDRSDQPGTEDLPGPDRPVRPQAPGQDDRRRRLQDVVGRLLIRIRSKDLQVGTRVRNRLSKARQEKNIFCLFDLCSML